MRNHLWGRVRELTFCPGCWRLKERVEGFRHADNLPCLADCRSRRADSDCMFGLRSRQTRRIWSERKEKTSRRAQGRFSRRCSRGYARHSSGIHERQSATPRYSTIFGAGAEQGSGSRRTGKECRDRTGNKAQAETRGETETCVATARAGYRAAFTLAAAADTAKRAVALARAAGTAKCPVALAGTGA